MVPNLGREESLSHRRSASPFERRQKPHAHDHGQRVARGRSHSRAHAPQGALMDRRTSLKWVMAAAASVPSLKSLAWGAGPSAPLTTAYAPVPKGYGADP